MKQPAPIKAVKAWAVVRAELASLRATLAEKEGELAKMTERAEFAERAKFGSPCKCDSWMETCMEAEERAERAQEALRKIAALTKRRQLPLTSEINEIASAALAGQKGE